MTNILEIDSVLLEFGTHRVLQNVYLKCQTGNITGLLGRNGTGKSCGDKQQSKVGLRKIKSAATVDEKLLILEESGLIIADEFDQKGKIIKFWILMLPF